MVVERAMLAVVAKLLLIVRSRLRSQSRLQAEILVLRQQVLILSRKSPSRVTSPTTTSRRRKSCLVMTLAGENRQLRQARWGLVNRRARDNSRATQVHQRQS